MEYDSEGKKRIDENIQIFIIEHILFIYFYSLFIIDLLLKEVKT